MGLKREHQPFSVLELFFGCLVQFVLAFCLLHLSGCKEGYVEGLPGGSTATESIVDCTVSTVRYPTTEDEFLRLYGGRTFLVDDVHIGRDIDLREGTAVYPIACGTLRFYRAASGYGTLVVVIEHHLPSPIRVRNGQGEEVSVQDFLSIYGHLRATSLRTGGTTLPWRDGDTVRTDQVIGYVQHAADNGDGEEHLHLGIRLQGASAAVRSHPTTWFAGYDRDRTQRRWYADPALFMNALQRRSAMTSTSTWHPTGTVLSIMGQSWYVASDQVVVRLPDDLLQSERLTSRIVQSVPAELACFTEAGFSFERTSGHRLVRFEGLSTVYEYADTPSPLRFTFLAQQAFDSWGWNGSQVAQRQASERTAFLERYRDVGSRRLRDGSIVRATGRSDVYVVSEGRRRPVFDWSTFLALGYDEAWIIEVDSSVLDVLAGPLGELIRPEDLRRCRGMMSSVPPPPAMPMDAGISSADAAVAPDMAVPDVGRDATSDPVSLADVGSDRAFLPDASSPVDSTPLVDQMVAPSTDAACMDLPRDAMTYGSDASMTEDVVSVVDLGAAVPADVAAPEAGSPSPTGAVMRYEFRLASDSEGWAPTEPYYLRDRYWSPFRCLNGNPADDTRMMAQGGGWYRCDTAEVYMIFVGTFFSPSHPTQGDRGHIATVDNWPRACSPRLGVEWRLTELPSGRVVYQGAASGLPCTNVGTQSRHQFP
jgi:hypothetical protein